MTSANKQSEDKVHRYEGKFTRNVKRKNSGTDSILGRTRDVGQARNECSPLHNLICEQESEFERSAKIIQSILPEHPLQKRTCQKNELRHFRWNLGAISQQLACGRITSREEC